MQLHGLRGFSPFDSSTFWAFAWDAVVDDWADSGEGGGAVFGCWDKRGVALALVTIGELKASDTTVLLLVATVEKFVTIGELELIEL